MRDWYERREYLMLRRAQQQQQRTSAFDWATKHFCSPPTTASGDSGGVTIDELKVEKILNKKLLLL